MRRVFLILVVLFLVSCERTDDIVRPAPPHTQPPPPEPPAEAAQRDKRVPAVDDSVGFSYENFQSMPYRLLMPAAYDSATQYPLHIFLHGIGERGTDNERQLSIGGEWFTRDSIRSVYPAFVVFPQCPLTRYWFDKDIMATLKALIDTLQERYPVDKERITIGGFSMGAYGTFAMTAKYKGLFRSAVAISGDGDPDEAASMAQTQWRIFAGAKDEVVSSNRTKEMAAALLRAGAVVDFTLYPETDHAHTWPKAFSEPDFFRWIFADNP